MKPPSPKVIPPGPKARTRGQDKPTRGASLRSLRDVVPSSQVPLGSLRYSRPLLSEPATPYGPYYGPTIPHNPHIQHFEDNRRGYVLADLTPARRQLDLRFVATVEDVTAAEYGERSFVVEDGVSSTKPS